MLGKFSVPLKAKLSIKNRQKVTVKEMRYSHATVLILAVSNFIVSALRTIECVVSTAGVNVATTTPYILIKESKQWNRFSLGTRLHSEAS